MSTCTEETAQQQSQRTSNSMIMPAVDEESALVATANHNSFHGIVEEAKSTSVIFDSFTSLDEPNGGEFGLSLEDALTSDSCNKFKTTQNHSYGTGTAASTAYAPDRPCLSSIPSQDEMESPGYQFGKDSASGDATLDDNSKPKRPLSAYNLFFQLERERLIAGTTNVPFTAEDVKRIADARRMQMMNDEQQPKRKHRKSHGKISFAELARVIAENWKALKPNEKDMLRERAANEKASYLKELEEWTKKGNKEKELQSSFESYRTESQPKQQLFECMDRSVSPSEPGNDFHGHLMDRSFNSRSTHQRTQSFVWQHEESSAHLGVDHQDTAPSLSFIMPPPTIRTPATRQSSIMWQHEDSIANLQDLPPRPPLWRSPSSVIDVADDNHFRLMQNDNNSNILMGMSSQGGGMSMMSMSNMNNRTIHDQCNGNDSLSGAVPAFQDDEDFNSPHHHNFHLPRKFNFANTQEMQQRRQQQFQDYVSMFQKLDMHDTGMRNMMMMMHQNQQHQRQQRYQYEHAPVHQVSLRQHLSYGASYLQQQQRQAVRDSRAPSFPLIDTQRRVRRPRRKSAPTLNPSNDKIDLHLDVEQQPQLRRSSTFVASSHSGTLQDDEQLHLNQLLATFD